MYNVLDISIESIIYRIHNKPFYKDPTVKRKPVNQNFFILVVFLFNGMYGQETHQHTQSGKTWYEKQEEIDHLVFQVENATQLSFADSSFDLVISQNVFHHIPNWEIAIKEVARVLRSGGYSVWLDFTFSGAVKNIFHPFVKNYGLYTINDMENAFEFHKFKKIFHEASPHGLFRQHHFILHLK